MSLFPPFDPDQPEPRRRGFRPIPIRTLAPNVITLLALCAGLTAIRIAAEGRFELALAAIVFAAILDGIDGRLARILKGTSRFGAEFDSLADFLCFGVAPAIVLYLWTLSSWGGLGWAPCLMYAVCAALRLARFNAAIDGAPAPAYAYNFFTGVPAPAAAGLALFPLFVFLQAEVAGVALLADIAQFPGLAAAVLLAVAALMVSTLPTWSFKNFKVPHEYVLPLLLGAGLYVALLVSEPWGALAAAGVIYAGLIPFGLRSYRRLKAEAEMPGTAEDEPGRLAG